MCRLRSLIRFGHGAPREEESLLYAKPRAVLSLGLQPLRYGLSFLGRRECLFRSDVGLVDIAFQSQNDERW